MMPVEKTYNASSITNLLFEKHNKDLCVAECKTGPTWNNPLCKRIDFWAMRRSWVKPNIYGYEIKISRNDFLNDEKWKYYLDYCTDFYFVCPPRLIDKNEIPPEAGLLITSLNCKRLYIMKKAPTRDIEMPEELYRYILMCRTEIRREYGTKDNYWQNWLAEKDEKKSLGYNVSKKIRELVEKRIDAVEIENHQIAREIENLKQIKDFMLSLGFDEKELRGQFNWDLKPRLERFAKQIPDKLPSDISQTISQLEHINKEFREILRFFDDR